jgi:hypothetical protein
LIEATREVVENLLAAHPAQLDTLYVTGGGSELPPVARVLRESFGRKVRRSAYMRSASAVGLAIRAGSDSEHIHERLNQHFGTWREAEGGGAIVFDLIFPRGVQLPEPGQPVLREARDYRPVHNIGHLRYLECSRLDDCGQPVGEITNWGQIQFPFDPQLKSCTDLSAVSVEPMRVVNGISAREEYSCDASGKIRVKISSLPAGNCREYVIGQYHASQPA